MSFSFSTARLNVDELRQNLTEPSCGGFSSFEGWVRDHNEGKSVSKLEYEAYEALAIKEGERIVAEALDKFEITKAECVHSLGALEIGDLAVWVGVSAAHRDAAFKACRYIIDQVKIRVPIWKKEHYPDGDSGWVNCEHCHTHGQSWQSDYSRQMRLPQIGESGQKRLAESSVLIIGAGGLGCPAISYLGGAGVGKLGIVDSDRLEASNLHRQTIFSATDLGEYKAVLAANFAQAINPAIETRPYTRRLSPEEILAVFKQYDVILDCTDNLTSKQLISDASVLSEKPVITASVYQYEGQLQVFGAKDESICFRCVWPDAHSQTAVLNCEESGVLGPVPGILGCLQALEALKILLGFQDTLGNDMLLINLLNFESRRIKTRQKQDQDEHACRKVIDLSVYAVEDQLELEFNTLGDAVAAGMTVVDIRDTEEISALPLTSAIELNRGELDWQTDGPRYLLVCSRGIRSKAMANQLKQRGISAYSLRGGANALS